MKKIDRRFVVSILAIIVLGGLGYTKGLDVAMSIATVAIGLAGANAYEKKGAASAD